MAWIKDPIVLWAVGAVSLMFAVISTLISAAIIGLPFALAFAAIGIPQETVFTVLLYSAIVWLPLGFGAGMATAAKIFKGFRARDPREN
ncbi:hypothetical protein OAS19_04270 [Altererythrobacter sp.]|nr:hypothetical protein [Altererythrobacter sp.]